MAMLDGAGRATWTKPQLLGRPSDLRNPIYVPEPDRVYSITCQTCNTRVAQRYCRDCDEYYCRQVRRSRPVDDGT